MWQFLDIVLTKLSNYFSLAAAIFSFWALLKLFRQQKKMEDLANTPIDSTDLNNFIKENEKVNTINPIVLCMSLLPDDRSLSIKPQVEQFIKQKFGKEMNIEELNMDGIKNADDRLKLVEKLKIKRREFEAKCVTEIHLFIAGPVAAGVLIGAIFKNWIPVKIYSPMDGPTFYQYWMPIPKQL